MPRDLQDWLRDGDPNAHDRISEWVQSLPPEAMRAKVRIRYAGHERGFRKLGDDLILEPVTVDAVDPFLDLLETHVIAMLGPTPTGSFRIEGTAVLRGSAKAQGVVPPRLDFTQTIAAEGVTASAVDLLRRQLAQAQRDNAAMMGHFMTSQALMADLLRNAHKQLTAAAATRVAGSTAADAGGSLINLAVLGLILAGWPTIRQSLGLPEEIGVVEAMRLGLARAQDRLRLPEDERVALDTTTDRHDGSDEEGPPLPPDGDGLDEAIAAMSQLKPGQLQALLSGVLESPETDEQLRLALQILQERMGKS